MPCICYTERNFSSASISIIEQANEIIEDYQAQGFQLTLRQLYYQFVARGLIPNKQSEYKRLGSIINDGRLAGLIDWEAIEDRTRNLESPSAWTDPAHIIESAAEGYAIDLWENQTYRPEVWVEKEALAGVVANACDPIHVPYFSCRGYVSQSEMHAAAKRLEEYGDAGQVPIIFHLGDHDPSGIDMTRDVVDRLALFAGMQISVERLALNFDQVRRYNPPPNPAKDTDSRHAGYVKLYGHSSWELDALDPATLSALIRASVDSVMDAETWRKDVARMEEGRTQLRAVSARWPSIVAGL